MYVLSNLGFVVKLETVRSPCQTIHQLDLTGAVTVEVFLCSWFRDYFCRGKGGGKERRENEVLYTEAKLVL